MLRLSKLTDYAVVVLFRLSRENELQTSPCIAAATGVPEPTVAKVLKAKGYDYQYLFCRGSGHGVGNAQAQFLPHAFEWVWKGYAPKKDE